MTVFQNMVYTLPSNFTAHENQPSELDGDVDDDSDPMVLIMDDIQSMHHRV